MDPKEKPVGLFTGVALTKLGAAFVGVTVDPVGLLEGVGVFEGVAVRSLPLSWLVV